MAAAPAGEAGTADRIDLVDEQQTGRILARLFEHVAHPARADADEHLHKIGTADRKERHPGFAGHGLRHQRFTGTGFADDQAPLRNLAADQLEPQRVLQVIDDLADLLLRLIRAGDIVEVDIQLIRRNHPRLALAEVHGAASGGAHLPHREEINETDHEQKRQNADQDEIPEARVIRPDDHVRTALLQEAAELVGIDDTGLEQLQLAAGRTLHSLFAFARSLHRRGGDRQRRGGRSLVPPLADHDHAVLVGQFNRPDLLFGQAGFELALRKLPHLGRPVVLEQQQTCQRQEKDQPDESRPA